MELSGRDAAIAAVHGFCGITGLPMARQWLANGSGLTITFSAAEHQAMLARSLHDFPVFDLLVSPLYFSSRLYTTPPLFHVPVAQTLSHQYSLTHFCKPTSI
jgi:hypothetical protein